MKVLRAAQRRAGGGGGYARDAFTFTSSSTSSTRPSRERRGFSSCSSSLIHSYLLYNLFSPSLPNCRSFATTSKDKEKEKEKKVEEKKEVEKKLEEEEEEQEEEEEEERVLPVPEIPKDRLGLNFSRSSGPGGQNVNKVNTQVEVGLHLLHLLLHLPPPPFR